MHIWVLSKFLLYYTNRWQFSKSPLNLTDTEKSGSDTEQYHEAPTSPPPSNDERSNTTSFDRNKGKQARVKKRIR